MFIQKKRAHIKNLRLSRRYSILLSCMLFGSPLMVVADQAIKTEQRAEQNQVSYICFDDSMSDIARVVYEISALDSNEDSPINLLKKHLDNGYLLGLQEEVLHVLEYAEWFVGQLERNETTTRVAAQLDSIIDQTL